jgi:hypothetical protein
MVCCARSCIVFVEYQQVLREHLLRDPLVKHSSQEHKRS